MRERWFDSQERRLRRGTSDREPDLLRLLGTGAVAAMALAFASTVETPFIAPLFSEMLTFGALGFAMAALFRRESPWASQVTAWDQAALLLLLGLLGGLFVDPAAVQQALLERGLIEAPAAGAGN